MHGSFFKAAVAENSSNKFKAMILDMDGVLWHDFHPIGNLPEVFKKIRARGIQFCLATNNSTLSNVDFAKKLAAFGVTIGLEQIITSSLTAAHYLKTLHPEGGPVYLVGESGLEQAFASQGFYHADREVLAVVAGMDRAIDYMKLSKASQLIRAGAIFIGTNPDRTFPTPEGLMPGAGAILAALQAASGISPLIIGKPEPKMYMLALDQMHSRPEEALVVGDRLETDIAGAQRIGCRTALVLSGVSTLKLAESWQPEIDFIEPDLASLVAKL